MKRLVGIISLLVLLAIIACSNIKTDTLAITANTIKKKETKQVSEEFKKYWYAGTAEITSYELEQARYGEIRKGKAALIYVTEDFLAKEQVKADRNSNTNIPVLKLNTSKKFVTGIYPYSIMQSVFYPVTDDQHALKVSNSIQEWCGHVYAQLNNREQFEVISHSYFQSEADQEITLQKNILENELWTKIRIDPTNLPQGTVQMIPSFEYCRLRHKEIKAYTANTSLQKGTSTDIYHVEYPELARKISITYKNTFPYEIERWTETFKSGFGANAKELTTKATKIKRITSDYWSKNKNKDEVLRDQLGL